MFTSSGALSWVGKQAQLNANALSLWEGWHLITQAITKQCAEAGGLDIPLCVCLHHCHSGFAVMMGPPGKRGSRAPINTERSPGILIRCHPMTKTGHHNVAKTAELDMARPISGTNPNSFTFTRVWV